MKRRDLMAKLTKAGLTLIEGGNHTRILRDGKHVSTVPRHREIGETLVRAIEKQTGVSLR